MAFRRRGVRFGALASATMALATGHTVMAEQSSLPQTKQGGDTLEEIVVTAQRRSENIQDVPVSVTAATGAELESSRVTNIENIQALSPSITFRSQNFAASTSAIQIRGVGTTGNSRSFEGAVGVFIDGVYRSRSGQALANFLDIDSLEILRGPQGTLFGKNTSAGAVLLTSNAPSLGAVEGGYEADYGNFDYYLVKAAVNVPLGDTAAARIAALTTDHRGYMSNPENTQHYNEAPSTAVKAQVLLEPTSDLKIRLIGDYAHTTGNCCYGTLLLVPGPAAPLVNALGAARGLSPPSTDINAMQAQQTPTPSSSIDAGGTLLVDFNVGPGTLHSVTAGRHYQADQSQDGTFNAADILPLEESFDSKFYSQELTYTGNMSGSVDATYIVGGYYSYEDLNMGRTLMWGTQAQAFWNLAAPALAGLFDARPGIFSEERMGGITKSEAVFTHWDFKLNDKFNLIAGVRYAKDSKSGQFSNPYFRNPIFDPFAIFGVMPGVPYSTDTKENSVSGTLTLQYHLTKDAMLYTSYNRGFKAGGINFDVNAAGTPGSSVGLPGLVALQGNPVFKPETTDAFEIGGKFEWFDGHARTNAAMFYYSLHELQVAQFIGLQFAVLNAPTARVAGAEIDQLFKINQEISLTGAATWLPKATYGTSPNLDYISGSEALTLSGRRFPTAPKFAGNIGASLDHPISGNYSLTSRIQAEYQSEVFTSPQTNFTQGGFLLLNGNIGIKSSQGWAVEAWGQNLTNKRYLTSTFPTPLVTGTYNAYVSSPRTYGVALRGSF